MVRFFSGARNNDDSKNKNSILRKELKENGKITPETYKKVIQQKLSQARANAANKENSTFNIGGMVVRGGPKSASAEKTMQLIAALETQREAKAERKRVEIEVRNFINGKINKKGTIYDQVGNVVATVNKSNGVIKTTNGQYIGQYKPKSYLVATKIQDTITKHSPYLINQRNVAEKQKQQAAGGAPMLNAWGNTDTDAWGRSSTGNVWGGAQTNGWGNTQMDGWGNQQLDAWGNQI